jgi:shikimate dehydrogenase
MENSRTKNFAVIGNPISHSLSPILFKSHIGKRENYFYSRVLATNILDVKQIVEAFEIKGINVTAPFKKDILTFCTFQSSEVLILNAANTIIFEESDVKAYNTDVKGVEEPLRSTVNKQTALILGAGGAAKAVVLALKNLDVQEISIANRTKSKALEIANIFDVIAIDFNSIDTQNFDIIVNTIPDRIKSFSRYKFKENAVVFDANYKNKHLQDIVKKGNAKYISGIFWLMEQGKESYSKMTGFKNDRINIEPESISKIKNRSKRISLIGPMGSWKTTVGRMLAVKLDYSFVDLDEMIVARENLSIKEIFDVKGEGYFRKLEHDLLNEILEQDNIVLSTGGGIIKQEKNIKVLKKLSWNILLYSSPKESLSRINIDKRPLLEGKNVLRILEKLFIERKNKYFKTSDLIVNTESKNSKLVTEIIYEDYSKTFLF